MGLSLVIPFPCPHCVTCEISPHWRCGRPIPFIIIIRIKASTARAVVASTSLNPSSCNIISLEPILPISRFQVQSSALSSSLNGKGSLGVPLMSIDDLLAPL
ncbi:hypothetical protein NE237_025921 [Protea cynaroides]|uniref:Uncharacterized protein n=1 Tax=Protea cynaroides TaxID=273540 RepID=A0A9Q0H636_9MAGN|nr:hypothetical protein NE237_025921 [Protea cynaroides]